MPKNSYQNSNRVGIVPPCLGQATVLTVLLPALERYSLWQQPTERFKSLLVVFAGAWQTEWRSGFLLPRFYNNSSYRTVPGLHM